MPDRKQPLFNCPQCGLPFKTEENLSLHITNWHSDETAKKKEKKIDPGESFWHELVYRAHNTSEGFEGLSEPEKRYFAVCLLNGEVYNGGFHQYFFNSSGGYYDYALFGLQEMNATHSIKLLKSAKQIIFEDGELPKYIGKRRKVILQSESKSRYQLLNDLDDKFYENRDDLDYKITEYAKLHRLF